MRLKACIPVLSLLLACIFFAGSVNAANIFLKPKTQSGQQEELEEPKDIIDLLGEKPAKPVEPQPAPKSIKEYANLYYKNCLKQDHPVLKGESLEVLCSCTAAQVPGVMTVEQWKKLGENSAEGEHQRNRMLMFIYTPCIKYPTRALIMDKCMNDPKIKATMRRYPKVCACVADDMAAFMDKNASHSLERSLARNSADTDPLRNLLESKAFEEHEQFVMSRCVKKHEFGRGR